MTNHRAGKTNTRDPRSHRYGKDEKRGTARFLRRASRSACHSLRDLAPSE